MALKFSTGLTSHILSTGSLISALNTGLLMRIYSGPVPVHADDALDIGNSHEILRHVQVDGTDPVEFEVDGVQIQKLAADVWTDARSNEGYASFFRLCTDADTGVYSDTAIRVQGTIGMSNASDLVLLNTFIAEDAPLVIDSFIIVMPNQ